MVLSFYFFFFSSASHDNETTPVIKKELREISILGNTLSELAKLSNQLSAKMGGCRDQSAAAVTENVSKAPPSESRLSVPKKEPVLMNQESHVLKCVKQVLHCVSLWHVCGICIVS